MNKLPGVFKKHKYMFAFFVLILFAQFIGNADRFPTGDEICYAYHVVDFSLGFVSRVLPGQIFMLFFKNPTMLKYRIFETVLLGLVFLCTSYFLEKVYLSAPNEHKLTYSYILGIFCISGSVFHIFVNELGMLDIYWIYALVMFFFILQSKKTWFFIPVCFVFAVMVNFGAFLCYIPLMSIILLYKASLIEAKSEKKYLLTVFAVSVTMSILIFIVLLYNEENNVSCTREQLHSLIQSRGSNYFLYYDYALFRDYKNELMGKEIVIQDFELFKADFLPSIIKNALNRFAYQIYLNFELTIVTYKKKIFIDISLTFAGIPFVWFYHKCCRAFYKQCQNGLKKFAIFCSMALFWFTFLGSVIFTIDKVRYFHHAIICIFILFLYYIYKESEKFGEIATLNLKKIKDQYLLLYAVTAFISRFYPYL